MPVLLSSVSGAEAPVVVADSSSDSVDEALSDAVFVAVSDASVDSDVSVAVDIVEVSVLDVLLDVLLVDVSLLDERVLELLVVELSAEVRVEERVRLWVPSVVGSDKVSTGAVRGAVTLVS